MPEYLQPPIAPPTTLTGGSAVMSATDDQGQRWVFDNSGGSWVNANTGESLTPQEFARKAGRTGNAAVDTNALAAKMSAPATPSALVAAPTAPSAPVAPPISVSPPMGIAPPSTPVTPTPRRFLTPEQLGIVNAQRPVPSTVVPPPDDQVMAYKQNMASWLVRSQGYKPADAMKLVGITPPGGGVKPIHVGNSLVDPTTGKPIFTAPLPEITPYQRAMLDQRKAATEVATARAATVRTPEDRKSFSDNSARMAVIQKEMDKLASQGLYNSDAMKALNQEAMDIIDEQAAIKAKYNKSPVTAPTSTATTAAPVVKPAETKIEETLPLPKTKEVLVKGKTYQTKRGPAKWNGEKFVSVE